MANKFTPTLILGFSSVLIVNLAWGDHVIGLGYYLGLDMEDTSLGDWGGSFSALNTAFSGLAFVGIAATIFLQVNASKQNVAKSGREEFERIFFQMFSLIRELRKEIEFEPPAKRATSMNPFEQKLEFKEALLARQRASKTEPKVGIAAMKSAYQEVRASFKGSRKPSLLRSYNIIVNRRNEGEFSPYFRAVYSLLRKIDQNPFLTDEEKLEYGRLLRSQMTSYESAVLGINGLTPESKDLMDYIIKYRMLKYSKDGEIREALEKEYPIRTFQGRG